MLLEFNFIHSYSKSNISKIEDGKTFTDLTVEELDFKEMNGIKADDFILMLNSTVKLSGDITFLQTPTVQSLTILDEKINDAIVLDDIVKIEGHYNGMIF